MDLHHFLTVMSVVGAAVSAFTTGYFWLIRVRSERPYLSCDLVDRELFLSTQTADKRYLGLKLALVVANGSSLPNAVLSVKVWIKQRYGWLEAERITFDKATPRPINVPALQTAILTVSAQLPFPLAEELEGAGNKTLLSYSERFLTSPRAIKVELKGLNDHRFTQILPLDPSA